MDSRKNKRRQMLVKLVAAKGSKCKRFKSCCCRLKNEFSSEPVQLPVPPVAPVLSSLVQVLQSHKVTPPHAER